MIMYIQLFVYYYREATKQSCLENSEAFALKFRENHEAIFVYNL